MVWVQFMTVPMLAVSQVSLVSNGDFEEFTNCPEAGWFSMVLGYWNVQVGSPDYFNRCHSGNWGIPTNVFGNQNAEVGNDGYIGLATYTSMFAGGNEIAKGTLSQTLMPGLKYRVRFKASMADSVQHLSCCVGVILSAQAPPNPPYQANISNLELVIPVAEYQTETWIQFDGLYTATGGENKIYIGSFRPDSESFPVEINPNSNNNAAYFYIDDVEVYEDDTVTGQEEAAQTKVAVWYDATSQTITTKGAAANATVKVFDASGRAVASGQGQVAANGLQGFYVVRVLGPQGDVLVTQKIVVP